ncbi:exodeoxyribonuclease V subunit beta [Cedecea davisae]|uniref:RecBCD enzyme subunit RecB n=1 Tax=Cedecea davisae TaxID=158484 RepID=A0ABS6DBQ6_9ENTR|nr:exodeoxyribonuclease V subunit beta [Cedecea davisae]MBU4680651.1 exodeoxyribonuclease V subunit beta [Cedecea davisae]MBU4685685.1 exodeoxyribonuclease V subunit beta [Cedecea davisae]
MTDVTAQPLDPLSLPLCGERLIEASAGTGKTFTIAALYLRLLLGLGGENAFPRPLGVEELLVVTFTEAATEELRGRIRANIHELRIACIRNLSKNPLLQSLLSEIEDKQLAARTLLLAEQQMDEAAIFTIHGFCQRMLSLNAFESGMLFEQQLLEDESLLRRHACADFWRRHCYPLPKPVAQAMSEEWSGPEALLRDINSWLQGEQPQLKQPPADNETLLARHEKIITAIDSVKTQWRAAAGELASLIGDSGVDKRSYSSKHLPNWLEIVGLWAQLETTSYQLPDALAKFAQSTLEEKTKKGEVPRHSLFSAIDALLAEPLTLRDLVIARAMAEIRYIVQQEKKRRGELGFDDMLSRLDEALHQPGGDALAEAIRGRFPVAMIDEFQDTDPQQYRIFRRLYIKQPQTALLLIGDPKQAIYAFRGADIFTYMKARHEVSAHYTLDTNWRSAPAMIDGVNTLFQQVDNPFLFRQIPFLPVKSAPRNSGLRFTVRGESQAAMKLWLQPGEGTGVSDYQQAMATQCARQIRDWLTAGQRGEALLWTGETSRKLQASDMTILVRSRGEAAIVRDALGALNIPSVYLSNRDSVFATPEARELLWILQAVLAPEIETAMRSAIATSMLGLDALDIESLNKDELAWDRLVEEFFNYRELWLKRGVMPMLRALITARHIAENLLATPGGERRLTDILHISELLQEAAGEMESEHALVRWLAQRIADPDSNASSQQLRLESDKHLVKVVTIHKSKGLEYPLVWLPFVANYRPQSSGLYHDRTTFTSLLDLSNDAESLGLAEEERLAEDLRLLYVALTRSVWHCSLGVAPLFRGTRAKKGASDLHLSALGYLLQKGEALDAEGLRQALDALNSEAIEVETLPPGEDTPWQPEVNVLPELTARRLHRRIADNWRVTSYSGLQQHGSSRVLDLVPRLDVDAVGEAPEQSEPLLTPHTFPRGASPGTFLHSLFEGIDFTQPVNDEWVAEQLTAQGFGEEWRPVVSGWLEQVLAAPLNEAGVALNLLSPKEKQVELEFYLPIEHELQAEHLDALIRHYDPLSAGCPPLDFRQVKGMLKGFIDLVFRWQGRYYLLDYKSNWLGEDSSAYTREAMAGAMQSHRYDLQYQLYTLALHRYLRHRMAGYNYQQHFGGVIYLFLRGVEQGKPEQGIFATRPGVELVEAMDALFAGKTEEVSQ